MVHFDANIRRVRHLRGFTLVEAIFVISIIGILGAIALPRYADFTATQQTEAAARRVLSDLSYAQRQARLTSSPQRVIFDTGSGTYHLPDMQDPDHKNRTYSVNMEEDPYRAVITSAVFGTDATVVFDGYGAPDTPGIVIVTVGKYRQTVRVEGGLTHPRIDGSVSIDGAVRVEAID